MYVYTYAYIYTYTLCVHMYTYIYIYMSIYINTCIQLDIIFDMSPTCNHILLPLYPWLAAWLPARRPQATCLPPAGRLPTACQPPVHRHQPPGHLLLAAQPAASRLFAFQPPAHLLAARKHLQVGGTTKITFSPKVRVSFNALFFYTLKGQRTVLLYMRHKNKAALAPGKKQKE